jgi:hypothetical protein
MTRLGLRIMAPILLLALVACSPIQRFHGYAPDDALLSEVEVGRDTRETVAEKIGRPLTAIHTPVPIYDAEMAARVQRMFTALRPGQVLWRANALLYEDPALHQPRLENAPRQRVGLRNYLRSERQCLLKLPVSGAVVFSIHTTLVHIDTLPKDALAAFRALHP